MDIEVDNNKPLKGESLLDETYEEDTFQCGRCKSQFQILSEFMSHKKFQCESSEGVKISEHNPKLNSIPLLDNSGIDNDKDELSGNYSQETKNSIKEKISNVIEQLSGEGVSFVLNDDDGNLVEFPSLAGQVILTPNVTVDGGPILLNNTLNCSSVGRLVLASDSGTGTCGKSIVITCPINDLILTPPVRTRNGAVTDKIVTTSKVFNCPIQSYPTDGVELPSEVFSCPNREDEIAPTAEAYTCPIQEAGNEETLPTSEVLTTPIRSELINGGGNVVDDEIVLSSETLEQLENGICLETLNYFGLKPTDKRSRVDSSNNLQSSKNNQKLALQPAGDLEQDKEKVGNGDGGWYEQDENEEKRKSRKSNKKEQVRGNRAQLSCSYCGKPFEKAFNLAQHERTHTGERPFQCIICGRAFTQKSNVRKHMVRHKVFPHGKLTLKGQSNKDSLTVGKTLLENGQSYSCPYCPSTFKTYSEHKKHLSGHSDRKVYRCIQKNCNEMFSDLDDYLSHSKQHSAAEFQCHVCLKMFYSLDELGAHQYDHDVSEKERDDTLNGPKYKVKCQVCHSRFQTAEALKHHMAIDSHHYECAECKSVFHSERFLRRHLSTHVDPTQMNFECPHCGKKFRTQKFLDNHLFVHLEEKPFTCEHCDKKFSSKYRLKRHLAIHLNQFYECPFRASLGCTKTFYRKDKLRDHVSTHNHLRLHVCPFCAKTYSSTATLNNHMRRHHKVSKNSELLKVIKTEFGLTKRREVFKQGFIIAGDRIVTEEEETATENNMNNPVANIEIIMVPCIPTLRRNRK